LGREEDIVARYRINLFVGVVLLLLIGNWNIALDCLRSLAWSRPEILRHGHVDG